VGLSPYRQAGPIVHRDIKPPNAFQLAARWLRRARRRFLIWRKGTWRSRFVRCSLCLGPLECVGFTNSIRRQLPNAHHLHKCEPRRTLRTLAKIAAGDNDAISAVELKRALAELAHWGCMVKAFPEFMPATGDARRKLLEMYGERAALEIPPGDFRTVNEVRAALGLPANRHRPLTTRACRRPLRGDG